MSTESTRESLLAAAATCVETHGLRSVTVQTVLDAASFSRRTFYQHFKNKDDVISAVYAAVCDDLVAKVESAVEEEAIAPAARLSAGIRAYLQFQQEGGLLVRDVQAEAVFPGSLLFPIREQVMDRLVGVLDRGVREVTGIKLDVLVYRTLYIGLEGLIIKLREGGVLTPEARDRAYALAFPLFVAALEQSESFPSVD